jgi:hypothetical protein
MQLRFLLPSLAAATLMHAANPAEALRGWSAFENLDLDNLAKGKVVTEANPSMDFARGISVQAVYVVAAPLEVAARVLLTSDPTRHKELEVYQHRSFQNERGAEFDKLKLDSQLAPVRKLLDVVKSREGLHLSREENARLPRGPVLEEVQRFCSAILRDRWTQFAQHGEFGRSEPFDLRGEIRSLLAAEPKLAGHFDTLLSPLTQPGASGAPTGYYWNVANVDKTATLELGAVYTHTSGASRQVLETTFFASSGYLASLTFYELHPIALDGQPRTLVWQGSLVSSEQLAGAFGLKHQIASRMMASDLEDSVHIFQKDAASAR